MVWLDNNGIPGDVAYIQEEMTVRQGEGINGFYTYILNDPLPVNGIFYIGWKQRSETFLNGGFDVNTPNGDKQFYWLNGNWNLSQANGSLMIRPVTGRAMTTTAIRDVVPESNILKIWPNPANSLLNIDAGELLLSSSALTISIYDISGREIMTGKFKEQMDVSRLPNGIYLLVVKINGKLAGHSRFIKTR
jgi:hypothetical protein